MTKTDSTAIHSYNHGKSNQLDKYNQFIEDLETREAILSAIHGKSVYVKGYKYEGEPILLTEFSGIGFKFGNDDGWGYSFVTDQEGFIKDYRRVLEAVYRSKVIYGCCYTQLTGVEQEINGLLTYDRKPKCDLETIKEVNGLWHKQTI